jgi:drug/metabolite transporter (DMT)-like permease
MRASPHPYALATVVFWALAYVLTRIALEHFSPLPLGFLRYAVAGVVLLAVTVIARWRPPRRADVPWFLAAGLTGFFCYIICFNLGQAQVSAATASVVIATVPVITAVLAWPVLGERLRVHQWVALAVQFCGVAVLTLWNGVLGINAGVAWLGLAAVALSVYNLLQRRLTIRYSGVQAASFSVLAGAAMLAVFAPQASGELSGVPTSAWVSLAVMGVLSSAAAYACWSIAFAKADRASQVSNYMFLTPLLTALLGALLAGEVPDTATALGGLVILAGMVVFAASPGARVPARSTTPADTAPHAVDRGR